MATFGPQPHNHPQPPSYTHSTQTLLSQAAEKVIAVAKNCDQEIHRIASVYVDALTNATKLLENGVPQERKARDVLCAQLEKIYNAVNRCSGTIGYGEIAISSAQRFGYVDPSNTDYDHNQMARVTIATDFQTLLEHVDSNSPRVGQCLNTAARVITVFLDRTLKTDTIRKCPPIPKA